MPEPEWYPGVILPIASHREATIVGLRSPDPELKKQLLLGPYKVVPEIMQLRIGVTAAGQQANPLRQVQGPVPIPIATLKVGR